MQIARRAQNRRGPQGALQLVRSALDTLTSVSLSEVLALLSNDFACVHYAALRLDSHLTLVSGVKGAFQSWGHFSLCHGVSRPVGARHSLQSRDRSRVYLAMN